jgi:hypothetical protein
VNNCCGVNPWRRSASFALSDHNFSISYYWVMLRQVITVQPGHDDILLLSRKFSECSAGNFTQMGDPAVPVWLLSLSEEQQLSD